MNPTWKIKLAVVAGVLALIAGLLLIIKYQRDIINKQETIEKSLVEMKQLPNNVIRSEAKYVTSDDLNKFANSLDLKLDPIRSDLKSLNADIKGIQVTNVNSVGSKEINLPSDKTEVRTDPIIPGESLDKYGYLKNVQVLTLEEPFADGKKVNFGEVRFSAWKDKPWDLTVSPRKYTVLNVLGEDEDGKHYTYSKFSVVADGKTYDLKIADSKFQEELPSAKWSFNPQLYLSADFGAYLTSTRFEFIPNLQLMLFSYGQTKSFPDWNFLGLGFGYTFNAKSLALIVSPANYNIAKHLPLVKNVYIGPSISINAKQEFSVLGGIRVGL